MLASHRRGHCLSRRAQPRHDRRQPRACRPCRRLALCADGARRHGTDLADRRAAASIRARAHSCARRVRDIGAGSPARSSPPSPCAIPRPSPRRALGLLQGLPQDPAGDSRFAIGCGAAGCRRAAIRAHRRWARSAGAPVLLEARAARVPSDGRCSRPAGARRERLPRRRSSTTPSSTVSVRSRCKRALRAGGCAHDAASPSPSTARRSPRRSSRARISRDFLREQPTAHRHQSRVRAGRLRRLHRCCSTASTGALLHRLCRRLRGTRCPQHRGARRRSRRHRLARGLPGRARAAMRLLHAAGHAGDRPEL